MSRNYWALLVFFTLSATFLSLAMAAPPKKRVKRPTFDKRTRNAFFDNAKKHLHGERPNYGEKPKNTSNPNVANTDNPKGSGYAWSKIISAETLEDEIKKINLQKNALIQNPGKFKSGGFKLGRLHFSMLAVWFGIISEYDSQVRWKKYAGAARDKFGRAGANCKVGTIQVFNEAKLRMADLGDLISGSAIPVPANTEVSKKWEKVAQRPPIMQRLETAEKTVKTLSSNFKKNNAAILHEAEIIAAIGDIIARESYEYADDDGYADYCKMLKQGGLKLVSAVKLGNQKIADDAMGMINKSCSQCHDDYR